MSEEPRASSRREPDLPDVAYAVALAGLREMTPARLRVLLEDRPAREVYEQLLSGHPSLRDRVAGADGPARAPSSQASLDLGTSWGATGSPHATERARAQTRAWLVAWRRQARSTPVARVWQDLRARGIDAVRRGDAAYPARLLRARQVPELLYVRGRIHQASAPCVAIVGTRRATHYGLEVAFAFGRELAERGVVVVSGLARGIDASAHQGVLAAAARPRGPLAVVGGGVDMVYPRENRRLWEGVLETGGILSEAPPGAAPESWRFPLRNRIIAALSQVLVVVESSRQGGAIHTVLAADAYGVPVLAVPGSVRSPQSEGTNAIIQEGGAGVALDVHDVLAVLSMACEEDGTPISFTPPRLASDLPEAVSRSWRSQPRRPGGTDSPEEAAVVRAPGPLLLRAPIGRHPGGAQQAMDLGPPRRPGAPRSGGRRSDGTRPAGAPGGSVTGTGAEAPGDSVTGTGAEAPCTPAERAVLEAVDYSATLVDLVCLRTQLDLGVVALAIDHLEELGLVRCEGAAWVRC
ncbi:MAG TPA: DNA-processing protein DprA [Acidimicrobiales bacterium]|nr:DNA-processing protein DprA [Acidimicrobiales bacterium]